MNLHQGRGCANGCNAPFGVRCPVCNTENRADEERIDHALIEAAAAGLFSERVGLPLLPWQQRFVDHMFIAKEAES